MSYGDYLEFGVDHAVDQRIGKAPQRKAADIFGRRCAECGMLGDDGDCFANGRGKRGADEWAAFETITKESGFSFPESCLVKADLQHSAAVADYRIERGEDFLGGQPFRFSAVNGGETVRDFEFPGAGDGVLIDGSRSVEVGNQSAYEFIAFLTRQIQRLAFELLERFGHKHFRGL